MKRHGRRLVIGALLGAAFGIVFLGMGGRIVMRLLAIIVGRETGFNLGGSLEVIAYGTIVGTISGSVFALCRPILPGPWLSQGVALAALAYAGTIATLPAHIAETARPFAGQMTTVLALFGLCFLLFGLALARFSSRGSSPAQEAAPAAPRE